MKYMKLVTLLTLGLLFTSCGSSLNNGNGNGTGSGPDLTLTGTLKSNELDASNKLDLLNLINAKRASGYACPIPDPNALPGSSKKTKAMPAVAAMKWHDKLELAALRHTNVLLEKGPEFNKVDPHSGIGDGNPGSRANAVGYKWLVIGENIAGGAPTVADAVSDWLASDMGHCEAIMDKDFVELGAAKLVGGPYGTYWTLDFGKPQ
jgi:Cysteine-rich secretory protein family